jgi:hypothetical protein
MGNTGGFARMLRSADGRLRSGWRLALFLAVQLAVYAMVRALSAAAAIALLTALSGEGLDAVRRAGERVAGSASFALLVSGAGLPVAVLITWALRHLIDRRSFVSLGFGRRRPIRDVATGLALGGALVMFTAGTARWLGLIEWTRVPLTLPLAARLLLAAFALASAAMYEELLCRGYVQGNLSESLGPAPAVIVASVIFALLHAGNPALGPLALVNLFAAGVLLGAARWRFGSLWAPWALHFAWNFVMGPVLGVPVSGLVLPSLLRAGYAPASVPGELLSGGAFGFEGGLLASAAVVAAIIGVLIWKGRPERAGSERPPPE